MTEQEYFAKTTPDLEAHKRLNPAEQYIIYKAIVEYGYEHGEIDIKPSTIQEDYKEFADEWAKAWKEIHKEK